MDLTDPDVFIIEPREAGEKFLEYLKTHNLNESYSRQEIGRNLIKRRIIIKHEKGTTMCKKTLMGKRPYIWYLSLDRLNIKNDTIFRAMNYPK